jgi:predicted Zn-dependent peptidase
MIVERRPEHGLTLLAQEMPDLRSVTAGVWLRRGSRHERPGVNGISHFIEHLVFKGTERRSSVEIARQIDAVGGQMDAFTGKDSTCFYIRVLDRHLDLALDLLTDIVLRPLFDATEIERERKVIYEEMRMVDDSPEELLFDLLYEKRFPDHMLGRPVQGTPESIAGVDRETLRGFFTAAYRPANLIVSVAGGMRAPATLDALASAFAALPPGSADTAEGPPPGAAPGVVLRDKPALEQLHLGLALGGLPQAHPDRHGLLVLSNLLGGTMSSRLFQKVREERGLAYSVFSSVNGHADCGFQSVYVATAPGNAQQVLDLVATELRDLKTRPVERRELEDSRENLKGGLMLNLESTSSRMTQMARHEMAFGRQFSLEETLGGIDAVTADDVQRLANATFRAAEATLAVVGPLNGFQPTAGGLEF